MEFKTEIITSAASSLVGVSLIATLAEEIKANMNRIISVTENIGVQFLPIPTPEPLPTEPTPVPTPPTNNNLIGVVDIRSLGVSPIDNQVLGHTYKDTYHNKIKITNTIEKTYYLIYSSQVGQVTYDNILTDGVPTTLSFDKVGIHILKNTDGVFSVEAAKSYISAEFLNQYNFSRAVVLIPQGTYIHYQGHGINTFFYFEQNQPLKIVGDNTKLIGVTNEENQIPRIDCRLENISLYNIIPSSGALTVNRSWYFNNVELNYGSITTPQTYIILAEGEKSNFFAHKLSIKATEIYTGIWVERANHVFINESKVDVKFSDHPIRINSYENSCTVVESFVNNSTTGIQIAPNKRSIIKNLVLFGNTVDNCHEESISIDSFGNNTALSPIIAKSYVDKVEDWFEDGFYVGKKLSLRDLYTVELDGQGGYQHKIVDTSIAPTPEKYLLIIEGGVLQYQFTEITKSEVVDNKLVLYIPQFYDESKLKDVEVGLHTGALNCLIEQNTVTNARPNTKQPAHGISLWGATYNCRIVNNKVDNCKQGMHIAGYGSFGVTDPDFFNYSIGNVVDGNSITNCDEAFAFRNFNGGRKSFGNKFINNKVVGGVYELRDQINFTFENNELIDCLPV